MNIIKHLSTKDSKVTSGYCKICRTYRYFINNVCKKYKCGFILKNES